MTDDGRMPRGVLPPRVEGELLRRVLGRSCASCGRVVADATRGVVVLVTWAARPSGALAPVTPQALDDGAASLLVTHGTCTARELAPVDADAAARVGAELAPQGGVVADRPGVAARHLQRSGPDDITGGRR